MQDYIFNLKNIRANITFEDLRSQIYPPIRDYNFGPKINDSDLADNITNMIINELKEAHGVVSFNVIVYQGLFRQDTVLVKLVMFVNSGTYFETKIYFDIEYKLEKDKGYPFLVTSVSGEKEPFVEYFKTLEEFMEFTRNAEDSYLLEYNESIPELPTLILYDDYME